MTYTGAGLILLSQDYRILLVQDCNTKKWGFPKGHREETDPNDLATALRELLEETGISPAMLTTHDPSFRVTKGSSSYLFRYAILNSDAFCGAIQNPYEISQIAWVPIIDLLANRGINGNKYLRTWIEDMQLGRPKKSIQVLTSIMQQHLLTMVAHSALNFQTTL
jgi:8-oxo-dGTP pyrophosphatase MutT (NUDIX family)